MTFLPVNHAIHSNSAYPVHRGRPVLGTYSHVGPGCQGNIMDGNLDGEYRPWRKSGLGNWYRQSSERSGYVIDLNRNGRYDRGLGGDGVLVFDMNGDGRVDRADVNGTNNMMKAAVGNYDLNGDGSVGLVERVMAGELRRRYQHLDRDCDGRLSNREITCGGGRVWKDEWADGRVSRSELYSVDRIPSHGYPQRLDYVDPGQRYSRTSGVPPTLAPPVWRGCHR